MTRTAPARSPEVESVRGGFGWRGTRWRVWDELRVRLIKREHCGCLPVSFLFTRIAERGWAKSSETRREPRRKCSDGNDFPRSCWEIATGGGLEFGSGFCSGPEGSNRLHIGARKPHKAGFGRGLNSFGSRQNSGKPLQRTYSRTRNPGEKDTGHSQGDGDTRRAQRIFGYRSECWMTSLEPMAIKSYTGTS